MHNQINLAIQILPKTTGIHPYDIVDKAIDVIKESGISYLVCPFETVVEGDYDQIMNLVKKIHEICYKAGADEIDRKSVV
jgi:uncharacterized protein YqgV (UPF0045/DUF77 family)